MKGFIHLLADFRNDYMILRLIFKTPVDLFIDLLSYSDLYYRLSLPFISFALILIVSPCIHCVY